MARRRRQLRPTFGREYMRINFSLAAMVSLATACATRTQRHAPSRRCAGVMQRHRGGEVRGDGDSRRCAGSAPRRVEACWTVSAARRNPGGQKATAAAGVLQHAVETVCSEECGHVCAWRLCVRVCPCVGARACECVRARAR
eukprot:5854619-Pleurochrysis_carterae.AAC.1